MIVNETALWPRMVGTRRIAVLDLGPNYKVLQLQLCSKLALTYPGGKGGMLLDDGDIIWIPIDDGQYRQVSTFCGLLGIDLPDVLEALAAMDVPHVGEPQETDELPF